MLLPLALFAVAALIGLIMAVRILTGSTAPIILSLLHAALAATGIVTLYLAVAGAPVSGPGWLSLGLFVIAALLGFFLGSFRFRGKLPPVAVIAIHAVIALGAFGVLGALFLGLV